MPGGNRFNAKPIAAQLLAMGRTVDETAAAAKVTPRTVSRWKTEDAFRAEVDAARTRCFDEILGGLHDAGKSAVVVLVDLQNDSGSDTVRLGAARTLLENLFRGRDLVLIEE